MYCVPVSSMNLLARMLNVLKWSVREMCTTRVCGCVTLTKARGVVEGPLNRVVRFNESRDRYEGHLYVALEQDTAIVISELNAPWGLRLATDEDGDAVRAAAEAVGLRPGPGAAGAEGKVGQGELETRSRRQGELKCGAAGGCGTDRSGPRRGPGVVGATHPGIGR